MYSTLNKLGALLFVLSMPWTLSHSAKAQEDSPEKKKLLDKIGEMQRPRLNCKNDLTRLEGYFKETVVYFDIPLNGGGEPSGAMNFHGVNYEIRWLDSQRGSQEEKVSEYYQIDLETVSDPKIYAEALGPFSFSNPPSRTIYQSTLYGLKLHYLKVDKKLLKTGELESTTYSEEVTIAGRFRMTLVHEPLLFLDPKKKSHAFGYNRNEVYLVYLTTGIFPWYDGPHYCELMETDV